MIIKEKESLASHTTVRIGGIATKFLIPESREDLQTIIKENGMLPIISGGSNLLINDSRTFDKVIFLGKMDERVEIDSEGVVYAGASVRLQKLINTINENGYGGIEFLFSVPGMVGGSIYMNAGRGPKTIMISEYLLRVVVMDDKGEISELTKEQCEFSYRHSRFMKGDLIILGAYFKFPKQNIEESKQNIEDRIAECKSYQDNAKPNFGSVFCKYNVRIMTFIRKHRKLFCNKKAHFSDKTVNWIVNDGQGSFKEAYGCIKKAKRIHKFFRKPIEVEVRIWE